MSDCVNSEGVITVITIRGNTGLKKAFNDGLGTMDGCSFVDTVVGEAALAQY